MQSLFFVNVAYGAGNLDQFITNVNSLIINPLFALLVALALAYFIYGVLEFLAGGESEDKRTKGKSHMLWGVVGLTIMLGVWGILQILLDTLNITDVNLDTGEVQLEDYSPSYNFNGSSGGGNSGTGIGTTSTNSSSTSLPNNTNNGVNSAF